MSSSVDQSILRTRTAMASPKHASLSLPRPSRYSVLLRTTLDFTRSNSDLICQQRLNNDPEPVLAENLVEIAWGTSGRHNTVVGVVQSIEDGNRHEPSSPRPG